MVGVWQVNVSMWPLSPCLRKLKAELRKYLLLEIASPENRREIDLEENIKSNIVLYLCLSIKASGRYWKFCRHADQNLQWSGPSCCNISSKSKCVLRFKRHRDHFTLREVRMAITAEITAYWPSAPWKLKILLNACGGNKPHAYYQLQSYQWQNKQALALATRHSGKLPLDI